MLPAITDFIQSTFTDSLKKFIQPAYITIASVFLLLNFVFIFPDLVANNILFAAMLINLNPVVQGILIAATILLLAYIFLSLSGGILSLMSGESWNNTWIGQALTRLQKGKSKDLERQSLIGNVRGNVALLDRLTLFPAEESFIRPTALGNVLNATASAIWRQYGIDMTALWAHMDNALTKSGNGKSDVGAASKSDGSSKGDGSASQSGSKASKSDGPASQSDGSSKGDGSTSQNTDIKTRLDNEKATLDFLVSMSFVLTLFAVEQVLVQVSWLRDGWMALWALIFLVLAYIIYRVAVIKARTWGDVVQMVFDLYRSDLKAELGLRNFANLEDERNVWERVSSWLLWGEPAGDVFASTATYAPSIVSSDNVKVTLQYGITTFEPPRLNLGPAHIEKEKGKPQEVKFFQYIYQSIEYVLLVNTSETQSSGKNGNQPGQPPKENAKQASSSNVQDQAHGGNPQNPPQDGNGQGHVKKDFYILISDPLAPRISELSEAIIKDSGSQPTKDVSIISTNEEDGVDQLMLFISEQPVTPPSQRSPTISFPLVLSYSIPGRVFEISTKQKNLDIKKTESQPVDPSTVDFELTITTAEGTETTDSTFTVFDSRRPVPDAQLGVYWVDTDDMPQVIEATIHAEERSYEWKIDEVIAVRDINKIPPDSISDRDRPMLLRNQPFILLQHKQLTLKDNQRITLQYIYRQRRTHQELDQSMRKSGSATIPPEEPRVFIQPSEQSQPISYEAAGVHIMSYRRTIGASGISPRAGFTTHPLEISISNYVHIKSVKGIKIKNRYNEEVDSHDLLNKDMPIEEEIEIAMLQLRHMSKTRHTANVLNNLGCAYALLLWFSEAKEILEMAEKKKNEHGAKEAALNLRMLKTLEI